MRCHFELTINNCTLFVTQRTGNGVTHKHDMWGPRLRLVEHHAWNLLMGPAGERDLLWDGT